MKTNKLTHEETMLLEEDLQQLRGLRIIDDDFMTKVFDGHTESIELVLRIILDNYNLKVVDVHTQVFAENLLRRSVRFDIIATDNAGKKYNIEIQRQDKGAGRKRARYNSSMMDNNMLNKGGDFEELPETYVIFITENDVLKAGFPAYHIDRWIEETKELFCDDEHILYVNGAYRDDTPIGKLMHDFSCTQPEDMNYQVLADRVRYFKETEEGREIMCKVIEDLANKRANERAKRTTLDHVQKMMNALGLTLDKAMDILQLSQEEREYVVTALKTA